MADDERTTTRRGLVIVGQAPPERADAAENRQRILKAVRRLLKKKPIEAICMDEVADLAGVGKGTLYRRFKDRASLCYALLDDDQRQLQERALRRFDLPAGASPREQLVVLIDALLAFTVQHLGLLTEADTFHHGQHFEHAVHRWQHLEVVRLLGALHPPSRRDHVVIAESILALLAPPLVGWHLHHGVTSSELTRQVTSFILGGVLGQPEGDRC